MFCVINTVNVKTGFGVPELQDGAQRSQSRAPAGSVVGGLEAPGPHPGGGTRGLREVCHAGAFRARRGGRGVQCNGPAGGLHRRQRLSQEPLSERHLDVHRRALQSAHGIAPRHSEHARAALGEYTGGRVWIENDEGDSPAWLEDKKGGRELRGRWLDMHDKSVSFDARRYHKVEPHEGSMWALAAYVPQAYARATEQHRQALREAGFPLPALS